jgi:transitional endoplasmic reticulum ATPase
MRKKQPISKKTISISEDSYKQIRSIWTLRTLLHTNAHSEFFRRDEYEDDNFMRVIGIKPIKRKKISKNVILKIFKNELIRIEKDGGREKRKHCTLFKNIGKLRQQMKLTASQMDLLAFFTMIKIEKPLEDTVDYIGDVNSSRLCHILADILGYEREIILRDLEKSSALISSGIVKFEKGLYIFSRKFELLEGIEDLLFKENTSSAEILDSFFHESKRSKLNIKNFNHLKDDIEILLPVLKSAQKKKIKGINTLIYGIPGCGKTEFVKVIAKTLKMSLYEINVEDPDGDPISGQVRFRAYQLCQKLLHKTAGIVMFDEIEDVFPDVPNYFIFRGGNSGKNKGWINKLLESNETPAFWICNSVHQIDAAYLRRFDYVMEMKTPPRQVRDRIIRDSIKKLPIKEDCIELLAKNENITPAQINKAAKMATLAKPTSSLTTEQIIRKVINNDLDLSGISKKVQKQDKNTIRYNIEYLNADYALQDLVIGLEKNPNGRICLYGYPGTGKTGFAHFMAEKLNKSLVEKRASDLLDKYVGGTENNIASMFNQAKREDALLLLDEADSFLQDRTNASHSWEITQVNEVLVQMENFEGIFFCSTNLMHNLDSASLRRFDLKIKFDYLTSEKTWDMFTQNISEFGTPMKKFRQADLKLKLGKLTNLTPGDFVVIKRQSKFLNTEMTADQIFHALEKESLMKKDGSTKVIGFGC